MASLEGWSFTTKLYPLALFQKDTPLRGILGVAMQLVNYLTVQDLLWIHLQLTKQVAPFQFDLLEDATFYQYGYGKSIDIVAQAGRLLPGFAKKQPFGAGNEAVAFVATLAFLAINGYDTKLSDSEAGAWAAEGLALDSAAELVRRHFREGHHDDHAPEVSDTVLHVIEAYPKTITNLLKTAAPV